MNLREMKIGETAAVKHTDLNTIPPPAQSTREATLMNTRLDTMWTFLSQLGLPVEKFIFSKVSEDGKSRSAAKIVLSGDYCVKIDIEYPPLNTFKGDVKCKYVLCKGNQKLGEGAYITDIKKELQALPICKNGIVTQNQ